MLTILRLAAIVLAIVSSAAWAGQTIEITTGRGEIFRIRETADFNVRLDRYEPLGFAEIGVDDKHGYPFRLRLHFKADPPRRGQFNSRKKMAKAVQEDAEKYLSATVEKSVALRKVPIRSTYGFYTVLTDAAVAGKAGHEPGEYRYMTRGMIRLSKNTAPGFSLMTNDVDSFHYRKMLNYVYSFVKPGRK